MRLCLLTSSVCAGPPDPFAGSAAESAPTPPPEPASAEIRPAGDLQEWFFMLQLADSGILYEDQYLQVGLPAELVSMHG